MLLWHADPSGVSGTGRVATGCEFGDGTVVLHVWQSIASVIAVHGHQGATEVHWLDAADEREHWMARSR